jgi:hypothetical protein
MIRCERSPTAVRLGDAPVGNDKVNGLLTWKLEREIEYSQHDREKQVP